MKLETTPRRGGASVLQVATPSRAGARRSSTQPRLTRTVPSVALHTTPRARPQAKGQRVTRCLTPRGVKGTRSPQVRPVAKHKANKPSTSIVHTTEFAADTASVQDSKETGNEASRTEAQPHVEEGEGDVASELDGDCSQPLLPSRKLVKVPHPATPLNLPPRPSVPPPMSPPPGTWASGNFETPHRAQSCDQSNVPQLVVKHLAAGLWETIRSPLEAIRCCSTSPHGPRTLDYRSSEVIFACERPEYEVLTRDTTGATDVAKSVDMPPPCALTSEAHKHEDPEEDGGICSLNCSFDGQLMGSSVDENSSLFDENASISSPAPVPRVPAPKTRRKQPSQVRTMHISATKSAGPGQRGPSEGSRQPPRSVFFPDPPAHAAPRVYHAGHHRQWSRRVSKKGA
jgi:hypothetical protein